MTEPSQPTRRGDAPSLVAKLVVYTVPIHIALPFGLQALARIDPDWPVSVWLAIHILFPIALLATLRLWKDQLVELVALIAINHVVTFFAYAAAATTLR